MLAGVHPFSASDAAEMFKRQRQAIPPAIGERAPGVEVPAVLEQVVRRLLEKDPDARYPHARALTVALRAPPSDPWARRPSPPPPAPSVASSGALPFPIVVALAVLAALVVAAAVVRARLGPPPQLAFRACANRTPRASAAGAGHDGGGERGSSRGRGSPSPRRRARLPRRTRRPRRRSWPCPRWTRRPGPRSTPSSRRRRRSPGKRARSGSGTWSCRPGRARGSRP